MAYIPSGSCPAAQRFANDCTRCKYGEKHCLIHAAQSTFNYDACNNKTARAILDMLVTDEGHCLVLKDFKDDLLEKEK